MRNQPAIIAHRGASGVLPEHTLEAYARAIDMGADYIEPDLVFTRDGHLVCRHDRYLGYSTDVADRPEFADRRTVKPGMEEAQWYIEDFTLEEIRSLRARQPWPGRSTKHDDQFGIPTFDDMLALVASRADGYGKPLGVYPETKAPGFFADEGYDFIPPLLAALDAHNFGTEDKPAAIQSFEAPILQQLSTQTGHQLVQLVSDLDGYRGPAPRPSLSPADCATYADVYSPHKSLVVSRQGQDLGIVKEAHALGLEVVLWTFRDDAVPDGFESPEAELNFFMDLGIDGLFSDFADTALRVRDARREQARGGATAHD